MAKTKNSYMHLNKLLSWNLDEKIADMVKKTCFAPFIDVKGQIKDDFQFKQSNSIITALASEFDAERWCFKFGKNADEFLVDFGLEDVLYITGLPINGKQVSIYLLYYLFSLEINC